MTKRTALVLTGAGSRGAFCGGVLAAISRSNLRIDRIVGSSSGAMNGGCFAAAVAAGAVAEGGARLLDTWLYRVHWGGILDRSLATLRTLSGITSTRSLVAGGLRTVADLPYPATVGPGIDFRVIVTALDNHGDGHEKVLSFTADDFLSPARRAHVFEAIGASCALPGIFAPVTLNGTAYVDGGVVNNTAIHVAIEDDTIDRLIVVFPYPANTVHFPRGLRLLFRSIDIVQRERCIRELRLLRDRNKHVEIIVIRPDDELPGTFFAPFSNGDMRRLLLQKGIESAADALVRHGFSVDQPAVPPFDWRKLEFST